MRGSSVAKTLGPAVVLLVVMFSLLSDISAFSIYVDVTRIEGFWLRQPERLGQRGNDQIG
jgi:hypothetical protein